MVKEKHNQIRTYDEDGFRKRAACLCFKDDTEKEILLITSSGSANQWVVPGGGIDPDEDSGVTASREVWEEAGVRGSIVRFLGVFQNNDRKHRTAVFELIVEEIADDWEESRMLGRRREWFSIEEADVLLSRHKPVQQYYLKLFTILKQQQLLASHPPLPVNLQHIPSVSSTKDSIKDESASKSEALCETGSHVEGPKLHVPDLISSSTISPALSNYVPSTIRQDGRLFTMSKDSFYAYATDHFTEVAWRAIASLMTQMCSDTASPPPSSTETAGEERLLPNASGEAPDCDSYLPPRLIDT